jgi:hypothetical protein
MKPNVLIAAGAGLAIGVVAELFFAFIDQIPFVGCLFTPVAIVAGFGLPVLIGALAVGFASSRDISAPLDGALAAVTAEFAARLFGFCASIAGSRSFFFGPHIFAGVGIPVQAAFSGVWSLGWFAISLIIAGILGAIGAVAYAAWDR